MRRGFHYREMRSRDAPPACGYRLQQKCDAMVTTDSLRDFAAHCRAWAQRSDNPSQRQIILEAAQSWIRIAEAIDRFVDERRGDCLPDLRQKLN